MHGITDLGGGTCAMLYNDKVIAQLNSDKSILLHSQGDRSEQTRKRINTFANYMDLPYKLYADWVLVYRGVEIPFTDGIKLEEKK